MTITMRFTSVLALCAAVLLLAASTAVQATSIAPPAAIRVRDYAKADCIADDTAAIQQAISDWHAASAARTTGMLDFGSGCYRTTATLNFGGADNDPSFYFGTIRGDSSVLASIHSSASPAVTFGNFKYSSIQGLGLVGTAKGSGIGMLLSHTAPGEGMGTNDLTFQDINIQKFGSCIQMGGTGQGYTNGAAAAAVTWIQLAVNYCTVGVEYVAYNTLDTTFINLTMGFNDIGVETKNGHQIFVHTGSGHANGISFWFHGTGNYEIDGFRDESATDAFLRAGCCGAGTFVTIRDSMVYGPGTNRLISIEGDGYTIIENSFIGGRIWANTFGGSMVILNSAIYDTEPWVFSPNKGPGSGMFYRSEGNYKPVGTANLAESGIKFVDQTGRTVNGKPQ